MHKSEPPANHDPQTIRARLVAAAADEFNSIDYDRASLQRIAVGAGCTIDVVRAQFADTRAALLASHDALTDDAWADVERSAGAAPSAALCATRVVDTLLVYHRRWRRLRSSVTTLAASDAEVRAHVRRQRGRHVDRIAKLRRSFDSPRSREEDALLFLTIERVCDAIADGEARELGVSVAAVVSLLRSRIVDHSQRATTSRPPASGLDTPDVLTRREKEIACFVSHGLSNQEIASSIGTSPNTVRNHLARVFEKLDIAGRVELASWVQREGLEFPAPRTGPRAP